MREVIDAGKPVLAGQLDADVTRVEPGGSLPYSVTNSGGLQILFGEAYALDRLVADGWRGVPLPWGFRLVGYGLAAGEQRRLSARIPDDAAEGRYRLRKKLRAAPGTRPEADDLAPIEVSVEFDVARC